MANLSQTTCPFTLQPDSWRVEHDPVLGVYIGRSSVNGSNITAYEPDAFQREYERIRTISETIARLLRESNGCYATAYIRACRVNDDSPIWLAIVRKLDILHRKVRAGFAPATPILARN